MIRSLRTGITGLRANQLRLDVIGNNIAGVNTTGFKRSRVLFQDALAQRISTGGRLLGSNPSTVSNVGNGVSVSAVDQVWSQGALEYTDLATDLAVAGDGFFLANSAQGTVLTRHGATQFDANGFLVTAGGLRVQGWMAGADGTIQTGALQDVRIDPSVTAAPVATGSVTATGNLSAEREASPDDPVTMSSVIYDGTGTAHTAVFEVVKTGEGTWSVVGAKLVDGETETALTVTDGDLTFDPQTGELTAGGAVQIAGTFPNGSALTFDLDLTGMTQYGGSTTASVSAQDGSAAGDLVDFGFDQSGTLILSFSNGVRRPAAQLALGMVSNPDGLSQVGDGFYATTASSGDLQVGRSGAEIAAGVVSGALEASNVDLAQEFTDMIVAQRGYQANARVITTSDELLQETVQLKR
jgi:flagellar hook protein FlgE